MVIKALIICQALGLPDEKYIYFAPSKSSFAIKRDRPVHNTGKYNEVRAFIRDSAL